MGSGVECIHWIQQSQASLAPSRSQGDIAGRCSRFKCTSGCGCEVGGLGKGVLRLLLRYEHTTLHSGLIPSDFRCGCGHGACCCLVRIKGNVCRGGIATVVSLQLLV